MADSIPMKVLLVDDEKNIRHTLTVTLKSMGHDVVAASSVEEAQRALKSTSFDFMLTDFRLDSRNGIELLRAAKQVLHPPVSAVMTAYASFENAVNAIKEGAFDYLPKPFSNAQLGHLLTRVGFDGGVAPRKQSPQGFAVSNRLLSGLTSPAMARLEEFVRKVAPTDANVLLVGESGTGKTELARLIHSLSPRSSRSFGVVNCTTLAETLIESELFGHVRGAFTGATHDHWESLS